MVWHAARHNCFHFVLLHKHHDYIWIVIKQLHTQFSSSYQKWPSHMSLIHICIWQVPCSDFIMSAMASPITGVWTACSVVCSGYHQRKHQSSASLAFVRGIPWWPVDTPHKGQWRWKCHLLMTSSYSLQIYTRFVKCRVCCNLVLVSSLSFYNHTTCVNTLRPRLCSRHFIIHFLIRILLHFH